MLLAHGASAGGANVEALVLAGGLIAVGVLLFVQKAAKPVVSVALVLAGIGLGAGGFTFLGGEGEHDVEAATLEEPSAQALRGLCAAREQLQEGNVEVSRAAFFDRSHAPLHDIADRVAERDRTAAADLLQAKEAVESGFETHETRNEGGGLTPAGLEALQRDLDRLIIAAVVGVSELGVEAGGCE